MAAYKDSTLGNPLLCPKERLDSIDRRTVEAYRRAVYEPERFVVAYAGVSARLQYWTHNISRCTCTICQSLAI